MVLRSYIQVDKPPYTYNSVDLVHYYVSCAKVGKGGINFDTEKYKFTTLT